jgi:predicted RNase H-like HicB family nuclease
MKYLIVIEKTRTGYSAYSPDMKGCVAAGPTREEVEMLMKEAVEFHLKGLAEEGYRIPEPVSYSAYLEVLV